MAGLAVLAMVLGSVALAGPAAARGGDNADKSSTKTNSAAYWSTMYGSCTKVADGNITPPYVLGTAPDGRQWSALIIKAGSTGHGGVVDENTVYVNPAPGSYTHKYKKSISHVITCTQPTKTAPPVDVSPVDMCTNIEGTQETVPAGKIRVEGKCVPTPPLDVCTEKPGTQTNPADCATTPPPTDVCTEKPGMQTNPADCATTTPPPPDVCTEKPGMQTDATQCAVTTTPPPTPSQEVAVLGTKIAAPAAATPAAANETRVLGTQLASTGAEASLAALAAMVLIVGGTAMVMSVRRRRAKDA